MDLAFEVDLNQVVVAGQIQPFVPGSRHGGAVGVFFSTQLLLLLGSQRWETEF
jgi:hypothetical protein